MTIDTSREAVERLLEGVTDGPWSDTGTASERWSVDYDGNCGWGFVGKKRQTPVAIIITKSHSNRTLDANARFIAASRELVPALLAERDAALAEVARLSTPPDDAEVNIMVRWLRIGGSEHSNAIADALTRLSQAHEAERKLADDLAADMERWRAGVAEARCGRQAYRPPSLAAHAARRKEQATAKHGSKT